MNKQIFTFLLVGDRLRGVVCGRCDNPYTLATMENIVIVGDTLYFAIAHEDWGEINPPTFGRQIAARLVQNEMIAAVLGNNLEIDPRSPPAWPAGRPFTLVGPIAPEGTKGNGSEGVDVWGPGTGSAVETPPGRTPIRPVNPAPVAQAQAPYRPPRTPWGDPDLEGKWPSSHMAAVPLQRAESFGTRNVLTDAEFAQRQAQAANEKVQDEADFDFDNPSVPFGQIGGGQSPPQHWFERGEPQRQASLIVDPPNGRLPALTPAAQKREADRRAGRGSPERQTCPPTSRSTSAVSRAASPAPSCLAATTTATRSCNRRAT